MQQELFAQQHPATSVIRVVPMDETIEAKAESAVRAILRLFEQGLAVSVSFSGSKDSSVLMHLAIEAAVKAKARGLEPRLVVLSSDTGVENR